MMKIFLGAALAGIFFLQAEAVPELGWMVSNGVAAENPAPKPATARHVHYSGKVQGVGFRWTTADIARHYPVTGWVKNLDDGRVELLVEGADEAVDRFLKAVRERWKDNIDKEEAEKQTASGKYENFEVVR